jgi:putative transposase
MVEERVGTLAWLHKRVEEADTGLLREMVKAVAEGFMSAEASAVCGAPYGKSSTERVNQRNGYRERALVQMVTECYVRGVSTRRVDGLVRTLGLEGISKSQVSELAKELYPVVEGLRSRSLDDRPHTSVCLESGSPHMCEPAICQKIRCPERSIPSFE